MFCIAFLLYFLLHLHIILASDWNCLSLINKNLVDNGSVQWLQMNCTGKSTDWTVGPMIFNLIQVDLTSKSIQLTGLQASPTSPYQLQTLPDMASQSSTTIAGINGGYFWRLDSSSFVDDVCQGKTRNDAMQNVSLTNPNYGVGDSLLKVNNQILANNCDLHGYSRPTALILDGINSNIVLLERGGTVPSSVTNAIGAGPNFVSYNQTTGNGYINIPSDDDNVNIYEHAANAGVGIRVSNGISTTLFMVTSDGYDGCPVTDSTCGLLATQFASFFLDYLKIQYAMGMDQGGSTTLWVKGENPSRNGVVSRSNSQVPPDQDTPRPLYDGLFVEVIQ